MKIVWSNQDREVYERIEFTLWQKIKFCFSNTFWKKCKDLISNCDSQQKLYEENEGFFAEIVESGESSLEKSLDKIRRAQDIMKKKGTKGTLLSYQTLLDDLMEINKFYNERNLKRHERYKKDNCMMLLLELKSSFDKGAKYVLFLKASGKTNLSDVEKQLGNLEENSDKYIINNGKIVCCDYFSGLELDGIIIKKGCLYKDVCDIILAAFSYLPSDKLNIKAY